MWGWSPGDGTFGTGTHAVSEGGEAEGHAHRLRRSAPDTTSRQLADEHIFIRPSTDAAALIAMAYVIVSEGLHDQAYCDRHVLGFDEAHLPDGAPAGASYSRICWARPTASPRRRNGPPRSPASRPRPSGGWRSSSPRTKPAALQSGYAPGRTAYRRAVPSRRLRAGGDHRQCRHRRRQFRRQQRRHRPCRHQAACRSAPTRSMRGCRRRCWPICWRAARPAAIRPTSR